MYLLLKKTPAKITNQETSIKFLVGGPFFDAPCSQTRKNLKTKFKNLAENSLIGYKTF